MATGLAGLAGGSDPAQAFRVFDVGTAIGARTPFYNRWDAAPRSFEEVERSLDGGLRYSLEGGSYESFRDQFIWDSVPSVYEFQAAVEQAFSAWEASDPETGLGTSLHFVADLATAPFDPDPDLNFALVGLNDGAEIDIFAETPHFAGATASAIFFVDLSSIHDITLSSGVNDYRGLAISGADIRIDPSFTYSLDFFRILLAHEIGHTIGLADVEVFPGPSGFNSVFLDDDYDGTSSATALATLTNSFALTIDPLDPDASPLLRIAGDLYSDPGLLTPGVDILMESFFNSDLAFADTSPQNDDFAGRQFLYPVPEPGSGLLLGVAALAGLAWLRPGSGVRRRRV